MPYLIIETSTECGLIACLEGEQLLFIKEFACGQNQSKYLMPELENCLKLNAINLSQLDCIGLGVGPGSYTGIRVGASVAQALAYSWNIPLIAVSSLNGFVPQSRDGSFASIIDARIAGAYVRKGISNSNGIQFTTEPEVCALEELPGWLGETHWLVTPNSRSLQVKLTKLHPDFECQWEERYPSVLSLAQSVQGAWSRNEVVLAGELQLMYLRKTQAERQKEILSNPSTFLID